MRDYHILVTIKVQTRTPAQLYCFFYFLVVLLTGKVLVGMGEGCCYYRESTIIIATGYEFVFSPRNLLNLRKLAEVKTECIFLSVLQVEF